MTLDQVRWYRPHSVPNLDHEVVGERNASGPKALQKAAKQTVIITNWTRSLRRSQTCLSPLPSTSSSRNLAAKRGGSKSFEQDPMPHVVLPTHNAIADDTISTDTIGASATFIVPDAPAYGRHWRWADQIGDDSLALEA